MVLFKLAWRNLWRNRTRTLIQLLAISGSLAMVIWLQNITRGTYDKMINDATRMGSGHLSLHHPDYPAQRLPELVFDINTGLGMIESHDKIEAMLSRLQIAGLARSSYEARAAMIIGIDFVSEKKINPLLKSQHLVSGSLPEGESNNQAYLGSGLCATLRLKPGNKLVLMMQDLRGQITSKLFRVGGIFKSGVQQIDNGSVFVDRQTLAEAFGDRNAVHEIALILTDHTYIPMVEPRLQASTAQSNEIKVFAWETTAKQLADTIKMDHSQLKVMGAIFFLLVAVGTVNLLLMSVLERAREFGLLRALGMDRNRIRKLVFSEALLLGIVGASFGLGAGSFLSFLTWYIGLDLSSLFGAQEIAGMLFEPIIFSAWEWQWMITLSLIMVILVVIASVYPAGKALRINPAEAMRRY